MSALTPVLHSLVTLDEDHPQTQHPQTAPQHLAAQGGTPEKNLLQQGVGQNKTPVLLSKTLHRTKLTSSKGHSLTTLEEQLYLMPQSPQPWEPRGPAQPFCHAMG